jgi:hypothetical protein
MSLPAADTRPASCPSSSASRRAWAGDVCVIATPDGAKFLDAGQLAELTGHPVRVYYKQPHEPDVLPPPDAFVIAPATFNTINKLAAGISDTLALGLVNEAVALGLPVIAVPWPNAILVRHPVFQRSIDALRSWGVTIIINPAQLPRASEAPAVFPWEELRTELVNLRSARDESASATANDQKEQTLTDTGPIGDSPPTLEASAP